MIYRKISRNIINSGLVALLLWDGSHSKAWAASSEVSYDRRLMELSSRHCAYYSACLALKFNKRTTEGVDEDAMADADGLVSMTKLAESLTEHGLEAVSAHCVWQDLRNYPAGFILVLKAPSQDPDLPYHYCFGFYQGKGNQLYIADPVLGRMALKVSEADINPYWDGYAILLMPQKKSVNKPPNVHA